jgi:DNA (cytosine-5)-methyltransferase 1
VLVLCGYQIHVSILNAAHYGVPQSRFRVIFMAAKVGFLLPEFPTPTHYSDGKVSIKSEYQCFLMRYTSVLWRLIVTRPKPGTVLLPEVTLLDAIGDLPPKAVGKPTDVLPYCRTPFSPYQVWLRGTCKEVTQHITANPEINDCVHPKEKKIPKTGYVPSRNFSQLLAQSFCRRRHV